MSESLPQIGTAIVDDKRYAVATHGYRPKPDSCAMMRGSAVPTMVWSMAARRSAKVSPPSVPTSWGLVSRTMPEVWNSGCDDIGTVYRWSLGLRPWFLVRPWSLVLGSHP